MTCAQCGCTVGWDCECNSEYNALIRETAKHEPTVSSDMSHGRPRLRIPLRQAIRDMERAYTLLETLVTREGVGADAANRIPHAQIILMGAISSARLALGERPPFTFGLSR